MALIDLTIPMDQGVESCPGEPRGYFMPFATIEEHGWASHQLLALHPRRNSRGRAQPLCARRHGRRFHAAGHADWSRPGGRRHAGR